MPMGARHVALALLVAAIASCDGDNSRDAGSDGGPDASADAGRDAGPRDSGRDAAPDAGEASPWVQVPGLPDGCMTEYTTDGSLMGDLRREACSGIAGCEQLVPSWSTGLLDFRVDGGYEDASAAYFFFIRLAPPSYQETWLVDTSGTPQLGLRSYRNLGVCRLGVFHANLGRFAFATSEPYGDGLVHEWVFAGTWDSSGVDIRNLGRLSDGLPVTTSFFQGVQVAPNRIALESAPWHSILDVTWDGVATIVGDPSDGGETYLSSIVGDTVLYNVYGYDHVRAATAGAHGEVLIAPSGVAANAAVTDGIDLAWIQGYDGATPGVLERLELWASPFAVRAEDLVPRKVADVPGTSIPARSVIGHGYVAIPELAPSGSGSVTGVYRLADGARTTLTPPDGQRFRIPAVYVGAEDIAVAPGLVGSPPDNEAIMFIRLDSLDFVAP